MTRESTWKKTEREIEEANAQYRAEKVERECPKCHETRMMHPSWSKCAKCSLPDLYPSMKRERVA